MQAYGVRRGRSVLRRFGTGRQIRLRASFQDGRSVRARRRALPLRLRLYCGWLRGRSTLRNQGNRSNQKEGEERAEASESPTRATTSMIIVSIGRRIKDFHFAFPSDIQDIPGVGCNVRARVCLAWLTGQSDVQPNRRLESRACKS